MLRLETKTVNNSVIGKETVCQHMPIFIIWPLRRRLSKCDRSIRSSACEEILQAGPGIRAMTIGLVQQRVSEESRRQLRNNLGKTQRKRAG